MNFLFVIGIFLAFFLQFLLLTKKNKSLSDKILAVWMFFIGAHLFSYYIYNLGYWEKYPHLIGIHHPIPLVHGPLLYLYTLFSLRKDQNLSWKDYLHFSPALIAYLYNLKFYFFYSIERKIQVNHGEVDDFSEFMTVSLIAFILSGFIYPIISYRLLGKHKRMINQNFSYNENINLDWLKYCIWGIGIIYLTVALISLVREGIGIDFGFNADLIIYSMLIAFIFFLGYFGIRQQGIFTENVNENIQIAEPKPPGEYKKSGLKQDEAEVIHKKLLSKMKKEKPFIEPKLTLNILANKMDISINHLSQIVNQFEGKNFYDFINEYRVEEFKEKISNPKNKNFSILALALDSGFNSKSSFNHVFKKHTGKTPSQYMGEVKN